MAGDIIINITAVDKASPQIRKIADEAKKAAGELKKAGTEGGKGLDEIGKRAASADTQFRTFERTSLAVGAAMGAVALGVIKVSTAAAQQERQIAAISRMYGSASDEILQFADSIQLLTEYSNDSARQSAILLNTLTANYGLAQNQIETLIARSADLAALHGRTLTEVTQMISNALRGEGEYIEQIGVTLNQTFVAAEAAARGMGNFISEMSAAEQAAFRYTLLLEQTASAQGYAMERAEGARGAISLLANEFGDLTQSLGSALGPIGDVAARFSAYALWMPLIASQTARVAAILVNASRNGGIFGSTMSGVTQKVIAGGLVIGALSVGLSALAGIWLQNKRESEQVKLAWDNVAASAENLNQVITSLFLSGERNAATWASGIKDEFDSVIQAFDDMSQKPEELDKAWEGFLKNFPEFDFEGQFQNRFGNEQFLDFIEVNPEDLDRIQKSMADIFNLMSNPYIDRDAMRADFQQLFDETMQGIAEYRIDPDDVDTIFANFYSEWARSAQKTQQRMADLEFNFHIDDLLAQGKEDAAEAAVELNDIFTSVIDAYDEFQSQIESVNLYESFGAGGPGADNPFTDFTDTQLEELEMFQDRFQRILESGDYDNTTLLRVLNQLREEYRSGALSAEEYLLALGDIAGITHIWANEVEAATYKAKKFTDVLDKMREGASDTATALQDAFAENMAGFIDSYLEAFNMKDPVSLLNLSSLGNEFTNLAGDIAAASSQLETVFRVIVGNTNAIGQNAQAVYDWAESLINVRGELGEIDRLLEGGIINESQYRAAQDAFDGIADANQRIQDSILGIQAIQAPFIEQFIQQQATALEALKGQSAEQQRITLGWMDSATAAQAYQLVQQAVAVGNGELGSSGAAAFEEMIRGAISVNPFLFDMLETIGLINGTPLDFEVNFEGVTDGMSEIEMLTLRIEDLIRALGGEFTPIDIKVTGEEDLISAKGSIEELIAHRAEDVVIKLRAEFEGDYFTGDGTGQGRGLPGTQEPIKVPVVPDYSNFGDTPITEIPTQTIPIEADASGAMATIDAIQETATITVLVETDTTDLYSMLEVISSGEVSGPKFNFTYDANAVIIGAGELALHEYSGPTFNFQPDTSAVVSRSITTASTTYKGPTFNFVANAAPLLSVINQYAGRTMGTVYFDVVTRNAPGVRHGGFPGRAHGGILTRLNEGDNPELLHFANGGTAIAGEGRDGIYMVPNNTMVTPSNNNRNLGGGVTVILNTGDFYGGSRPDLDEWFADVVVPTFAQVLRDQDEEYA